ncbi:DNA mismatch repair endonuclease MutL [Psychrosphaera sp. F3M07]|uniref:DNA mismatch repair endonuclease MutL n=1 Tax=Psychrosphaera sp. F3M07 TaxID=2841560 RepID=UPI001C092FFE|nr:DNA mismatch repair endonuclease MutL [Psychrosphaera sp. F3M07]MBU2919432.1 DNA mismatch repair endonuclease MutL [Psychrosphaera sp. F3M07]
MTIKILPPQLANQIAAGEVVERPASVVKELVENALDAGASKVEVDIDRGGHKRILIRDNGKGIDKEQLTLALSRHATSKIANIDDLEAISSLGFRGEALASISSVSRLTMTSKPAEQNEAWSAMAEGLAMNVDIKPAAHPNGTSVDVVDLFFNTPARRKFLRAEKTEFNHIETLIKRIALSRPDVSFILKHNQKVIKKYRAHSETLGVVEQKSKRIAEVINTSFIDSASVFTSKYEQVSIAVWIKAPELCVSVNPAQYSFVNGRMMRDKLIQHAIRQAYGQLLHPEQLPEYVIFIELPANEVDVNVHPAKHEVRFHHARLLHDLIVKTIKDALDSFQMHEQELALDEELETETETETQNAGKEVSPSWLSEPNKDYQHAVAQTEIEKSDLVTATDKARLNIPKGNTPNLYTALNRPEKLTEYQLTQAVSPANKETFVNNRPDNDKEKQTDPKILAESVNDFSVLFIQQNRYGYCLIEQEIWLVDANLYVKPQSSNVQLVETQRLMKTPLLVPVRLKLSVDEKRWCEEYLSTLADHGFDLMLHQHFLIVKQVPAILRSNENSRTLPTFFNQIMTAPLTAELLIEKILEQKTAVMSDQQIIDFLQHNAKQNGFIAKLKQSGLKLNPSALLNQ